MTMQRGNRVEILATEAIQTEFKTRSRIVGTVTKIFNEQQSGIWVRLDNGTAYSEPLCFNPIELRLLPKREQI